MAYSLCAVVSGWPGPLAPSDSAALWTGADEVRLTALLGAVTDQRGLPSSGVVWPSGCSCDAREVTALAAAVSASAAAAAAAPAGSL